MNDRNPVSDMFASRVCNPMEWFAHARSLLAAARATVERALILIDPLEKSDLENVATMLYAFSLENLLKAKWILKEFGPAHADGWEPVAVFPKSLKTHNLFKLAELVDKDLAEEFKFSLENLSDSAIWSGRYPCSVLGDEGVRIRWTKFNEDAEFLFKKLSREFSALI